MGHTQMETLGSGTGHTIIVCTNSAAGEYLQICHVYVIYLHIPLCQQEYRNIVRVFLCCNHHPC